jgi:hypothetical protein
VTAVVVSAITVARRPRSLPRGADFAAFLAVIGALAPLVYAVFGCTVRDGSLIRYTLLTLLLPIGIVALGFASRPSRIVRGVLTAGVLLWAGAAASDDLRVIREYAISPPPNPYRDLVNRLEREGVKYGNASYWTAYMVDFLSGERLVFGSWDKVRVEEYQRIGTMHLDETLGLYDGACSRPGEVPFERWCLVYLDRARHAR